MSRREYDRAIALRAGFLFLELMLIMLAYVQLKPVSRSMFLEHLPASSLPWLWIASALSLALLMPLYHFVIRRYTRLQVVTGSCALFILVLIGFRLVIDQQGPGTAVAFYIFGDIMGVVLIEQLWSMANSSFRSDEGRRWYGFIASGGLLGGILAGVVASNLLRHTALTSADLLLVAAGGLALVQLMSLSLARAGLLPERPVRDTDAPALKTGLLSFRVFRRNGYLTAIALILLTSQLVQPIVEYQFLSLVEAEFTERDERTAFLAQFFSLMSACALAVNLLLVPLIHHALGAVAGLVVQPLTVMGLAALFNHSPGLPTAMLMKLGDRGLSYSVNRASRELLYIPIDSALIYRAKAWIDMFGYRVFRILGALLIKLFRVWLPVQLAVTELSWLVIGICVFWIALAIPIRREYERLRNEEATRPLLLPRGMRPRRAHGRQAVRSAGPVR